MHYNVFNQQCELFEYLPLPLEADVEVEGTGACGSGREAGVTLPMVMADMQGGGCATSITSSITSANSPSSTDVSILAMKASPSKETINDKISFKKEGLPSSECFNCFVRHLGTFFGTQ